VHRQGQGQCALRIRCESFRRHHQCPGTGWPICFARQDAARQSFDGHTLGAVIEATERLTGREIERAYVDKGYRGHDAPNPRRVFISGQKRGVFGRIKRELTRRSAIEAVIGHMKAEGHLGRCYLKGRAGDAANVILSAVGYNLRLVLAWLRIILRVILLALLQTFTIRPASNRPS
jgi:IS5 family transposase